MSNQKKYKTFAFAKFEKIEPTKEDVGRAKAAATVKQEDLIKFALENKQEDLLYFKAVYATCGFNLNDDVFVNKEFWEARKSPVLKPTNWQHKDSDIIGVIYAVEAQYLDGTKIDIESQEIPNDDYELVIYGVVYKYTFPERAKDIEDRAKANELYVSMEAWFSDFDYAILENDSTMKVLARDERTIVLDKNLRCNGGSGKYNNKRIGRVLKSITFGGVGFVDSPANIRSEGIVTASKNTEIEEMSDNKKIEASEELEAARAKANSLTEEVESLKKNNATAAENLQRAAEKAERAEQANKLSEAILAKIGEEFDAALAGVGTNVPAEIAKVDNAKTADAKFAAKLSWLSKTAKAAIEDLAKATKEVEDLKAKVSAFEAEKAAAEKAKKTAARKAELKEVLADDELVDKLMKSMSELDDAAYAVRLDELKAIAAKSRPTLDHKGGQGSPDAEGASGEGKAASGPRENRKVSAAAALENAVVEQIVPPAGNENNVVESPFKGLASAVITTKKKKEE